MFGEVVTEIAIEAAMKPNIEECGKDGSFANVAPIVSIVFGSRGVMIGQHLFANETMVRRSVRGVIEYDVIIDVARENIAKAVTYLRVRFVFEPSKDLLNILDEPAEMCDKLEHPSGHLREKAWKKSDEDHKVDGARGRFIVVSAQSNESLGDSDIVFGSEMSTIVSYEQAFTV